MGEARGRIWTLDRTAPILIPPLTGDSITAGPAGVSLEGCRDCRKSAPADLLRRGALHRPDQLPRRDPGILGNSPKVIH